MQIKSQKVTPANLTISNFIDSAKLDNFSQQHSVLLQKLTETHKSLESLKAKISQKPRIMAFVDCGDHVCTLEYRDEDVVSLL